MRALFLFVLFIFMIGSSYANSRLPACQGAELVQWSNCYGTYEYDNGTVYTGDFKNNVPNGNGSMTNQNGNQYVGSWQNGYRHGSGIQTFTDGRHPQRGLWLNDNLIKAEQVQELNRTAQVEIDINRSKKTGISTLPKCKGIKQNSWWNDCFGMVNYPSGARYIGEFKNHEQDGMGIFIDKDYQNANAEIVKEGLWSNGRFIKSTRVNLPLEYVASLNSTNLKIKNEAPLLPDGKNIVVESPLKTISQQQDSGPTLTRPAVGKINELVSTPQLTTPAVLQSASGKRVALVIGNGDYKSVPKLSNSVNDANEISKALQITGFTVFKYENIDLRGMQDAIRLFGEKLGKNDVGLFFFAGHGVQVKGKNYLIPVGENIKKSFEVPSSAIDADLVLATMEDAKNSLNIVILDACRSPFPGEGRSTGRRLATLDAAKGTLIAYATAPGKEALDGQGNNSPYTRNLVRALGQRGLSIEQVFKQVRIAVVEETKGAQVPWENSSIMGDFYFRK